MELNETNIAAADAVGAELLNFRDFGGIMLPEGASVVADRLYRSGNHASLSGSAAKWLFEHDFALVVDLRYPDERAKEGSPWPVGWVDRVLFHDVGNGAAPHLTLMSAAADGAGAVRRAYAGIYRALPFDPVYRALFGTALSRLAALEGRTLIHCSAGKDRTGIFVAILLDLLAVPRPVILADYLRSGADPALRRLARDVEGHLRANGDGQATEVADALTGVDGAYLIEMFAAIEERHGSVAAYLAASGLSDATIAQLRERLIVRPAVALAQVGS